MYVGAHCTYIGSNVVSVLVLRTVLVLILSTSTALVLVLVRPYVSTVTYVRTC